MKKGVQKSKPIMFKRQSTDDVIGGIE